MSRIPEKRSGSGSSMPLRRSSRLHHPPIIRDANHFRDYALETLGIKQEIWDCAASAFCGGDIKKLMYNLYSDFSVRSFILNHHQQFKIFFERQVDCWLGNLSWSLPRCLDVEEEQVIASSIVIFSYLPNEIINFNRLRVFAKPPPSMPLLKTLDNISDHHWPACVALGSFVYFIGGVCRSGEKLYSSKKMFAFDIADLSNKHDQGPPPLFKLPNMNVGKSNPLALAANGKIYVLSLTIRELDKRALSKHKFNFSIDYRDWTLIDDRDHADWFCGAFEVYDPSTREWTILPLPNAHFPPSSSRSPAFMPTILHLSDTTGSAVVRDRLFFYTTHYKGPFVYTFDTQTLRWKSYDKGTRDSAEALDYYDSLAYQLLDNGMYGHGLVVKDTLYAFSPRAMINNEHHTYHFCIWVYRVSEAPDDKLCHSGQLKGFSVDCVLGRSVSMPLQASVLFIQDGKFGCLHVEQITRANPFGDRVTEEKDWVRQRPELRPCFTTFKVRVEAGNDGKPSWYADSLVEYDLNGSAGSKERFLACYAR